MNIGVAVSNEILSNPHSFSVRTLCRVLRMLDLTTTEASGLKDLAALADKMVKVTICFISSVYVSSSCKFTLLLTLK